MKKQHILATVVINLVIISGGVIFSACASVAAMGQTSGIEAQVNTAVAATLIQYMVETKVASQSIALASTPASQAQATQPPAPTPTPVPTDTPLPTAEAAQPTANAPATPTALPPTTAGLVITADQNTNCRVGPSTGYAVQTYFVEGSASTVSGKDSGEDWWYIVSPDDSSEFCWVWEGSTTVQGDTSSVPVVAAPAGAKPKAYNTTYYAWNVYQPYSCTNYYPGYCGSCVPCKPNQPNCNPNNWWNCNPNKSNCNPNNWWSCNPNQSKCGPNKWWYCNSNGVCSCKAFNQYPCKQGGCPPVTEVNYKSYCKKYPQCCNEN